MATIHDHHTNAPAAVRDASHGGGYTTDLAAHQRTFNGFVTMLKWNVIVILAILIFMALADA